MFGIVLRLVDLLARQLPGQDRVEALDPLRGVAVGDRLHFKRVQLAEIGDLVERQRGIVQQPDGGRLRHQRAAVAMAKSPLCSARPPGEAFVISDDGKWPEYRGTGWVMQPFRLTGRVGAPHVGAAIAR